MRTFLIIVLPPTFDNYLCFPQIIEPLDVQAFVAQSAVEAFTSGILSYTYLTLLTTPYVYLVEAPASSTGDELRALV